MTHDNQLLPTPPLFTEFPFRYAVPLMAPGDLRCTAAQRDSFRRFTQVGDPLADDVVAMFKRLPVGEGRRMFEIAVERGIDAVPDAPAELVALFQQLWRYVGFLLGIDAEILPTNETDTWRAFWILADTEFIPDEDSRRLAQALVPAAGGLFIGTETAAKRLIRRVITSYMVAYSRIVLGPTNSEFLGLENSKFFQSAVMATAVVNGALEVPRQLIPGATRLQEKLGARLRARLVNGSIARNGGDRTYARHDTFAARTALRAG